MDLLEKTRHEIGARLEVLEPLVREAERLQAAMDALGGIPGNSNGNSEPRSSTKKGKRPGPKSTGRRGRPKGSGKRGKQAVLIIKQHPGITIPEVAGKMGIKQNYLYRLLPSLAEQGLVRKDVDGRGWYPVGSA